MNPSETPRITRAAGSVMAVNSYLVEGPEGVVVVDGQLAVSDAAAVRASLDALEKPAAALLVTHGHPDHYAGAARLLDGLDAPIVATAGVDAVIRRDDATKDAVVGAMLGDEWPQQRRFPDRIVDAGMPVTFGGLTFTAHDLGPGESHHDSLWELGEHVIFAGDVAYNDMHAYLADGRLAEWLYTLDTLEAQLDDDATLYVGHGEPGGLHVLARQRRYVQAFMEAVAANRDRNEQQRRDAVVERMRQLVTNDQLLFLLELSIEPALAALRADA